MEQLFIDRQTLKYAIKVSGYTIKDFATKELGITRQAFYSKLNGTTQFTEKEIAFLVKRFGTLIIDIYLNN